jgi:branched-chain amino acid transport system permease protein
MNIGTFYQLIVNTLSLGSVYAVGILGLTLIFGVLEIVNFAHGEFVMLGMYATYFMFTFFGIDPYLSVIVVIPAFILFGLLLDRMVINRVTERDFTTQITVTVGLALLLRYIAHVIFSPDVRILRVSYSRTVDLGLASISIERLLTFIVSCVLIGTLFLFLHKTYIGKAIRAVALQKEAARLVGINVGQVYGWSFGLGIACAGAAGSIMVPIFPISPQSGLEFLLVAFIVVVFGGVNSLLGTFVAAFIVALVEILTAFIWSSQLQTAVAFFIFLIVLIFKPTGLLGVRKREY